MRYTPTTCSISKPFQQEAKSLHAEFTKGAASGRHSNKHVSHAKAFQTHAGATNASAANGPIRSRSQLASAATARHTIPMLTHNVENSRAQKTEDSVLHKARTLPPHLRGKANAQRREETGRQVGEEYHETNVTSVKSDLDQAYALSNRSAEVLHSRQTQGSESMLKNDANDGVDTIKIVPDAFHSKPLSFAEVVKMDHEESSQKPIASVGDDYEHVAVQDEPEESVPPIRKPVERSMSAEHLKTFNFAVGQARDCNGRYQSAIADSVSEGVMHKLAAGMSGEIPTVLVVTLTQDAAVDSDGDLAMIQRSRPPSDSTGSAITSGNLSTSIQVMNETHIRAQKTAMLERQRIKEYVRLARHVGVDEAIRLQSAARQEHETYNVREAISNGPDNTTNFSTSQTPSYREEPASDPNQATPNPGSNESTNGDRDWKRRESGHGSLPHVISEASATIITEPPLLTSSDQAQARVVETNRDGFNAALLPTFSCIGSTEPSTRDDALRQVVEVMNKQIPTDIGPSRFNAAILPSFGDGNSNQSSEGDDALPRVFGVIKKQVPWRVER